MIHYLITKHDADDFSLWVTEDIKDDTNGSSVRGSLDEIKAELDLLLK